MADHSNADRKSLSKGDLVLPESRSPLVDYAPNGRIAMSRPLETTERAALVEALRREFPDIFDKI